MRFLSFLIVLIAVYGCTVTWSLPLEPEEAAEVDVDNSAAPNNLADLADVGGEHSNDGERNARLIGLGIGFVGYRPYYGGGYGGWGYGRPWGGYYGGPWGYGHHDYYHHHHGYYWG